MPAALICAAALAGLAPGGAASAALPALTVYATQPTVRTSLHLQPGFALIVRADRRIDTVAVGDPRIVTAAPVRRGADVFDVVLQPLAETGTTNMVLWLGDTTTIWSLEIGPGLRTADVVFVVTRAPAAHPPASPATAGQAAGPAPPAATTPAANAGHADTAPANIAPAGAAPGAAGGTPSGGTNLEGLVLRETVAGVKAAFRALRTRTGVLVRYEITNGTGVDLLVKPAAILVRVDGRIAPYGMARDSVDRGRPDLIPRGATESGLIDIAMPSVRRIELTLPLLPSPPQDAGAPAPGPSSASDAPAARAGTAPSMQVPIVLQATFSGIDRLPIAQTP